MDWFSNQTVLISSLSSATYCSAQLQIFIGRKGTVDKMKERNTHGTESQGGYGRRTLAREEIGIIYFYDKVAKRYGRLTYRDI